MSKFYGTLRSDKGSTTRAGHQWIRATAQSYDGSVSVHLSGCGDQMEVIIAEESGSCDDPNGTIFRMPFSEFRQLLRFVSRFSPWVTDAKEGAPWLADSVAR